MSNNLCLHRGATVIDLQQLKDVKTPETTATWTPIPHDTFVNSVRNCLVNNGATIVSEEHAIYRDGDRYFGLINLANGEDGNLVVGLRNSHDKKFPAGLALGNRVFCCDNLSFSGDIVIARKHTRFINRDLDRLIYTAVGRLSDLKVKQETRFLAYRDQPLTDVTAHDLIIRAMQARIIGSTSVPDVVAEWHKPKYEDFTPRNVWSLFNDFTEILKGTGPTDLIKRTMTLHGLLDSHCKVALAA